MNISEWEDQYFNEADRAKRKELLDQRIATGENSEELDLIKKMFDRRYTPQKKEPENIDHMLRGILYLKQAANRSGIFSKMSKKEIRSIFADLCIDIAGEYGEAGNRILYLEHKHLGKTYYSICCSDRGYTSFIWGLGQLSDASIKNKLYRDKKALCEEIPEAIGMTEELKIFSQAVSDAFYESVK